VDNQDLWQLATLGIACVSNHRRHADEILSNVVKFVIQNYPDLELLGLETITLLLCPIIDSRSSILSAFILKALPLAN
jgi:hypothetical protein